MKVARHRRDSGLYESACAEPGRAFGRGGAVGYLDKPRHVEAQVIADQHGNVVVAPGTLATASLPEAGQEAPARPTFNAKKSTTRPTVAKRPGYGFAGTVEYLVSQDGDLVLGRSTRQH